MIMLYISCKNNAEAKKISKNLLKKKIIACANIFPIESMYNWKGKLVEDKEVVLILKALNKDYKKVRDELKKMHSYDVPFIGKINVKVNEEYENWAKKEVI